MNSEFALPVVLELLVKSALIAVAAASLVHGWRGATSAQRHLVWLVVLAAILLLPCTRLAAPRWAIPLQPAKQISVTLPASAVVPSTELLETIPLADVPSAPARIRVPIDWRKVLLTLWLGGAAAVLGYRLFGSWRVRCLYRRSVPVEDGRVRLLMARTAAELGLRRRVEVRLSEECRVPITWGTWRPVMLLPREALAWSDTWLTAALRHEAAHILRHDDLTRWFAWIACALYWPNPVIWIAARSLRVAQEQAADDLVLSSGTPPEEYATQLVDAARLVATRGLFARHSVAMACPSTLEDRIIAIVDGRRNRRPLGRFAAAIGSTAGLLTLALCTAAQLQGANEKPATTTEPKAAHAFGPEIEIEAKFVELPSKDGEASPELDKLSVLSDPQFQVILRALNQKKGVDILSSPRVMTHANQRAVIEIIREFRYPTAWKQENGVWTPTEFETKNVGTTMEVEPQLKQGGALVLRTTASVVELLGFVDLDDAKALPAPKDALTAGQGHMPQVPPGHRYQTVFSERKKVDVLELKSGETMVIPNLPETADIKPFEQNAPHGKLIVFLSARILQAITGTKASAQAAEPVPPPGLTGGERLAPIELATDGEFLRRVYLAITGTPPTAEELRAFLDDPRPSAEKRKAMVEKLTIVGKPVTSSEGAKAAEDAESPALAKAKKIVIPKLELRDESVTGVVDYLRTTAIELDPEKAGVNLVLQAGEDRDAHITLSLTNVPLSEALRYVAALANLEVRAESNALVIAPKAVAAGSTPGVEVTSQSATFDQKTNSAVFSGDAAVKVNRPGQEAMVVEADKLKITGVRNRPQESAALKQAREIILPKVELREASLVEAVDFLRAKAAEATPDKVQVNVVLKPGVRTDAMITLSLTNVSFIEALRYAATLANNVLVAEPEALVIEPAK